MVDFPDLGGAYQAAPAIEHVNPHSSGFARASSQWRDQQTQIGPRGFSPRRRRPEKDAQTSS
jgi:hypothetical protein